MQEGQLLMTQVDRDRLVALKKTKKKLITQGEAAKELRLSIRQVQRLLEAVKERGDKAVVHRLRGKPSNRKIEEAIEKKAVQVLSMPVYEGFGPTLGAESDTMRRRRTRNCCGVIWRSSGGQWRSRRTRRACSARRRSANGMNPGWTRTRWKCRRRRLPAR